MTLKQIEYFQMVCSKGNISTAANELFVSRSVISRAIAELEEEFETCIFTRSKNGVVLTESGKVLARLFDEVSACYSSTRDWINKLNAGDGLAKIKIGVTPTNAYYLNKLYFAPFREAHPEIQLYMEEFSAYEAWKLILEGAADAFVTPAKVVDNNMFDTIELYQTSIMLGAAASSPLGQKERLSISDILDLPLGYLNAPMPLEGILESCFDAFGKKQNVVVRSTDKMLLKELIQNGTVYSILPSDIMEEWEGVKGIPLDFFQPSVHRLVWGKVLPRSSALSTFLDFVREQNEKREAI